MFVAVPSQDLDFQHHMLWSLCTFLFIFKFQHRILYAQYIFVYSQICYLFFYTNIAQHEGHGEKFPQCAHDVSEDREWIKQGTKTVCLLK
jgi:hypothetical protein